MDQPSPSFSPEQALDAHGAFVRRLARKLLADAHLAEDLTQEAWARYFTQPPASANPRGWFARTLRHLAANTLRARARRREHEERGARPEALRSGAEASAEAEVLRVLVEAVLALEAAQRDTLLALYFRGLDVQTLARETGVPVPTVRDRQRRALALLRQRLSGTFGEERAWLLALARLAGVPPAPQGQLPIGAGTLTLASVLVVGGVGLFQLHWRGHEEAPAPVSELAREPLQAAAQAQAEEQTEVAPQRLPAVRAERAPHASAAGDDARSALTAVPEIVVRGRFVTSAGVPLAGVTYTLGVGGPITGTGRASEPPFPEGIEGLGGTSEADGRFELAFPPVDTYSVGLSAELAGFARVDWEFSHWSVGEYDFGDVTLYRSATWSGRVVDPEGRALTGLTWRVSAAAAGDLVQNEAYQGFRSAKADPATAEFRLEGLQPGLNRVSVRTDTSDEQRLELVLVEGETKRLDLVYAGADPRRRLLVVPSVRPLDVPVERAFLHLVGPDGRRHELAPPPVVSESGTTYRGFRFEALEPGSYTLECDDPRFQFVRLEGLQTGTVARPTLLGSSALSITVLDAAGARVQADEVQLELCDVNFWPRDFRARRGAQWAAGGLVRCSAGNYLVRVRHGGASGMSRVEGLAPGETRAVLVQLLAPSRITGRLVDELGGPYAGAEILAARPAAEGDSAESEVCRAHMSCGPAESFRQEIAATRTDAQGNFAFTFEEPGTVFLCVVDAFGTRQIGGALTLGPGDERTELPLVCPRLARVSGVLHGPPSAAVEGMRLLLAASSTDVRHRLELELPASGAFAFEGVPPGSYRLFLLPPEASWVSATGSLYSRAGSSLGFYEEGALCNGQRLASLEVRQGVDPVLELHVAAEDWPGKLALEILVDDRPAARWRLRLTEASSACEVELGTRDAGRVEQALFAGEWRLTLEDPLTGWRHSFPELLAVRASGVTQRVLAVDRP